MNKEIVAFIWLLFVMLFILYLFTIEIIDDVKDNIQKLRYNVQKIRSFNSDRKSYDSFDYQDDVKFYGKATVVDYIKYIVPRILPYIVVGITIWSFIVLVAYIN